MGARPLVFFLRSEFVYFSDRKLEVLLCLSKTEVCLYDRDSMGRGLCMVSFSLFL